MKQVIKRSLVLISVVMILGISCKAQQLVQTTNDLHKLVENKEEFIGKPLSDLLQQIKPPIKRVIPLAGGGGCCESCFFMVFVR